MKIVAFNASPRPSGNTEILLEAALKPLKDAGHTITLFRLNFMRLKPCQDCGGCDKSGQCIINDDMKEIYDAIRSADRIILASPIFFFSLSAQAKIMIDRCQAFWCEKYLLKRPIDAGPHGRKGLLLLVGGMKNRVGVECAEACAKAFFRTVSVPEHSTLSFLEVDAKGAILEHLSAIDDTRQAAEELTRQF
ncbi:MAG TPA: flavodoxin family protein [Dissulfurispiraceae bacterium]|nr:flavodoxin family protein [Dissulfurispiraceae bacterium]